MKMNWKVVRFFVSCLSILIIYILSTAYSNLNLNFGGLYEPKNIEIAKSRMYSSNTGIDWIVTGQVWNFEARAIQDILIGIMLYDANGDVVCSSFIDIDEEILDPSRTSEFRKTFSMNECPEVKTFKIQVDADWTN